MIGDALMPEKENGDGDKKMFGLVIPRIEETNLAELTKILKENGLLIVTSESELPKKKAKAFRIYQEENGEGIIIAVKRTLNELTRALEKIKPEGRFIPENCICI